MPKDSRIKAPCPFCGEKKLMGIYAEGYETATYSTYFRYSAYVSCDACDCQGPSIRYDDNRSKVEYKAAEKKAWSDAIDVWNRIGEFENG